MTSFPQTHIYSTTVSLEAVAGAITTATLSRTGFWKQIATACETIAGAGTTANADLCGYILRSALVLESVEGTSPAGYSATIEVVAAEKLV